MARMSMDQDDQHHLQAVHKEFKVKGSVLAVSVVEGAKMGWGQVLRA